MAKKINIVSERITQPRSQGASQAMLHATGLTPDDMNKAQVGIASVWYEGNPCNMHLLDLAAAVKEGVEAAGMVGMRFNTVGVSDAISMGTEGMSYSLQSRDLIADSIETIMGGQWYDANVSIPGCDKNMPGCLIAMGRLNRPALMVYGGTIKPGHSRGETLDIVSAFQCYGQYLSGEIDDTRRREVVQHACPGAGACGGMYTANTMASAIEAMGMSLPYSSSIPAVDIGKNGNPEAARGRHSSARHHDPPGVRKRDGADYGSRRLDERSTAPDRDGARGGRRTEPVRLPESERSHAVSRRSETERTLRDGRSA